MQVMDGLTRRELEFVPLRVKRSISRALEDKDESIRAYVVGGRNVLKSWVSDDMTTYGFSHIIYDYFNPLSLKYTVTVINYDSRDC
jgi:hypothetical protein